jgi:hypothetical protein
VLSHGLERSGIETQGVLKSFEEFKLNAAIKPPLATFDISVTNPGHLGYALDILVFNN